jgi:peptidoglycan/xylan/chitin deacetylase (PgdA/CDA1 family)
MDDVLVLCLHSVSRSWPATLAVTPERLENHLARLVRRGYRGVTFAEAIERPEGRVVAVTFDDAYRSVLTLAAPILARYGLPGTVYAPTDWTGRDEPMAWPGIEHWVGGEHEDALLPLGWDELAALAERGWEIGSHTCSHPHLTRLGDDELADELERSREEIEQRLGRPCRTIAYPYGDQDDRVRAAARRAGYAAGAALGRSLREGDRFAWPRVGIYRRDDATRFALKTSRLTRRMRGMHLAAEYFSR